MFKTSSKTALLAAALFVTCTLSQGAVTPLSFTPNPADLNDLDHHSLYTWRIDSGLPTATVTGATLTFVNIRNWDSNPNTLFIHLLDTAKYAGVAQFIDDKTNSVPVSDITDDFANTRYHNDSGWLVAAGTGDKLLDAHSFGTTATTYVYNFTASELTTLNNFIRNGGDVALGFDPDCHYFNDGIKFDLTTASVPEVPAAAPLAAVVALVAGAQMRRRKSQATS